MRVSPGFLDVFPLTAELKPNLTSTAYRSNNNMIIALLIAQRALSEQPADISRAGAVGGGVGRVPAGLTAGKRPFPCSPDAIACIVEEWSWF